MGRRLDLHAIFTEILGSSSVYFQPPPNIRISFPCIIYSRVNMDEKFANDQLYLKKNCYSVSVIDDDPDSMIPDKIGELPLTRFERHYTSDNLNHDVYLIYY